MCARAAAAMSGGVDSSAAAWLLREQGFELAGVTMRLPGDPAQAERDAADAQAVAASLGLPHFVLDLSECFRAGVIGPFAAAYESGCTPNPCVDCNREVKFGALLRWAVEEGWERLATGHYVRSSFDAGSGRWLLRKALCPDKDQSYVLCRLTQEQLARSLFPLGELSKGEVRAIAEREGLVTAHKSDSQDICFVPDGDYAAFLRRYTGRDWSPGPFLDEAGRVLGIHKGIVNYTVGQRRGLGVSSSHGRLYVKEIRPADNAVVLAGRASLLTRTVTADRLNWIAVEKLFAPLRLRARLRYHMAEQPCTAEQTGPDTLRIEFDSPQRTPAPGQALVLYDGDVVVGSGTILKGEPVHESEEA